MSQQNVTPVGVNHVVLNVRDIEESHRFWTEVIGLKQVGALRPRADMGTMPKMRFYSGDHGGKMTHHDVAIVENPNLPAPCRMAILPAPRRSTTSRSPCRTATPGYKKLEHLQTLGDQIQHARQSWRDPQRRHQRSQRLRCRTAVRTAARDVGSRHRRRPELSRAAAEEGKEALVDDLENAPRFGAAAD